MDRKKDVSVSLNGLRQLVRRLRAPDGCPWDRAQALGDIGQYLLEECYEALEAMERPIRRLCGENWGDLLFSDRICRCDRRRRGTLYDGRCAFGGIHEKNGKSVILMSLKAEEKRSMCIR